MKSILYGDVSNKACKAHSARLSYHSASIRNYLLAVLFCFLLTLFITMSSSLSPNAYADDTDVVTATLTSSCTMTGTTTAAHTAAMSNSVNKPDIGTTNINVACNDAGGFGIFAIGYSSDTEGTTAMISSAGSDYNIATGTATSGNASNWSMKVTPGTGLTAANNFDTYHAVPANYTKVVEKASGTQLSSSVSASTTYQVYLSSTQPAGTYTGKVKYTLVHPSNKDCPEGYELNGGVCKVDPCHGAMNMQDITASYIATMTTNNQVQMCDARDHKLYWVAKLADGNVWMTQNLDFVISTSGTTLTTDDSNVASNKTITAANGWTNTDISFYEGGDSYLPNGTDAATSTSGLATDSTNWHYHVGNFYNWPAATAGSGTSSAVNTDVSESICPKGWRLPTSASYTTNYSFGKLTNAYGITNSAIGPSDTNLLKTPLWFMRAGYVSNGSLNNQGTYGYVWSSRAYSSSSLAHILFISNTLVNSSGDNFRYYGFNVRCVAI